MAILFTLTNLLTGLENNLRITSTETGVYGDSTSRTAYLNLGAKAFCRDTKCLKGNKDTSLTAVTSQQEYDLFTITNYQSIDREGGVLFDSTKIPFKTIAQLYAEKGNDFWSAAASKPECYYLRGKRYLGLHPKPSVDYLADVITVFYNKRPADMATGTDTPFDSNTFLEEYTEAPLLWATWKLLTRAKQTEEALMYAGLYEKMKNTCRLDLATDEPTKFYLRPTDCYHRNR